MSEKIYYKKINPNLFSDSKVVKQGKLSKEFFSYYLESLTSQSKEKEFEDFCRKIVEVTICPNLLPQTGPTGGGDSKVDSETYPVADSIAETWLYGYGDSAHKERWAFAISAKKDWKPKLKSDVKKIFGTNEEHDRDYKKIYFITNQFVSDRKRADAEDELRKEYQLDIRILDRTWLLDKTFKDGNQKIAIEAFNMSEELEDVIEVGVKDTERRRRLGEIDKELQDINKLKPARIINLSKESIKLLRELEIDKSSAIAVLERNIRFAKQYGNVKDYANALYDYCWTILWWYEDRDKYYEVYVELENLYKENRENYSILKGLSTLWINLLSNRNKEEVIKNIDNHTQLLVDSFNKFIQDYENPKRAELAKFDYQMMRMQKPELWPEVVEEYLTILQDMHFNNDIDLFELKKLLELPVLKNFPKYDELFEMLIELLSEQSKNVESSQLLVNRGDDYLESDIYKAIKYYSRALTKLFQERSKINLIETYIKLGAAFEQINLMWGARSFYIRAFIDSFYLYFDQGNVIPELFLSMRHLKFLELKLGRINYSLQFNEWELIGYSLYPYKTDEKKEWENYLSYDLRLANTLLNIKLSNIELFGKLPDYLDESRLKTSTAALKYKLGYYDDEYVEARGSKKAVDDFMKFLFEYPISDDIRKRLDTELLSERAKLQTKIMSCSVVVYLKRDSLQQELGATLLAMLENVFATSISEKMISVSSEFTFTIDEKGSSNFDIEIEQVDNTIKMIVSNIEEITEYRNRSLVSEKLNTVMDIFVTQMMSLANKPDKMEKSIEEESTMFRTLNCSSTLDTFVAYEQDFSSLSQKVKGMKVYKNIREKELFQDNKESK